MTLKKIADWKLGIDIVKNALVRNYILFMKLKEINEKLFQSHLKRFSAKAIDISK
jgi:hypothetical protein